MRLHQVRAVFLNEGREGLGGHAPVQGALEPLAPDHTEWGKPSSLGGTVVSFALPASFALS
jgi:hypothetical protein